MVKKLNIQTPTKIKLLEQGYSEDEIRVIIRSKNKKSAKR